MAWLKDTNLDGEHVFLIPLERSHSDALVTDSKDGKLWGLWFTQVPSPTTVNDYVEAALKDKSDGVSLPFVVINKLSGKIIGSTRFCHADASNRRLEIGYTWYSKSFQKTSVNTETKLLLLNHAFEELKCIAVEFRTHWHNMESRRAISRLGAKQDGIIRNHQIQDDGSYRDTVVFSILESEWQNVKKNLNHQLRKRCH